MIVSLVRLLSLYVNGEYAKSFVSILAMSGKVTSATSIDVLALEATRFLALVIASASPDSIALKIGVLSIGRYEN